MRTWAAPAGARLARLAALLALAAPVAARAAAAASVRESALEAVFLYRFASFVRWPSAALPPRGAPFVIGILGPDPFGGALQAAVRGETVAGHPIVVRELAGAAAGNACQIVFVDPGEEARMRQLRPGALTVGETETFLASGGMIRFQTEARHIRLVIDLGAARRAGLEVSSQLLRLAEVIGGS